MIGAGGHLTVRSRIGGGRRRLVASLAIALAATPLAACGGGAKKAKDSASRFSASGFSAQANALCVEAARANTVGVPLALGARRNFAQETEAVSRYSQTLRRVNARLRVLRPPAALADGYARFTAARDQAESVRKGLIAARRAHDLAKLDAAYAKIGQLDGEAFRTAERLGLSGCDFKLPPKDEASVAALVQEVASSTDGARVCGQLLYPGAVRNFFPSGGNRECIAFHSDPRNRETARVMTVGGVEGVSATAAYAKTGGRDTGTVLDLIFYDKPTGRWRLWYSQKTG
jgi:hypothetical protein